MELNELRVHVEALRGRVDALERWKEAMEAVDVYRARSRLEREAHREQAEEQAARLNQLRLTRRQVSIAAIAVAISLSGTVFTALATILR